MAGSGPAGWAIADRCARLGLRTTLVAPAPHRPWRQTYGLWFDQAAGLPLAATATNVAAIATGRHRIERGYGVLDNTAALTALTHPDVEVRTDRLAGVAHGRLGCTVTLTGGGRLAAAVLVDATGARATGARAEQTAVGVVVSAADAEPVLGGADALFMDWRHPGGDWPTFLYAVPVGAGRVLLEETSLARRPGLPVRELSARLLERLTLYGIDADGPVERVRFPLDAARPRFDGTVAFGARGGLTHPATGYSVGDALTLAPSVASAIAEGLAHGPRAAARAAHRALWPPAARAVHLARRRGLAALLALPPHHVPEFFELFFQLPAPLQRAYLSGRADLGGTTAAMAALFGSAPWSLRARLVR